MLTLLSYTMITCFMYLVMSKRLSPLVALILVPVAFAMPGRICDPAGANDVRWGEDAGPNGDHADLRDPLLLHDDRCGPLQPTDQADP